MYCANCGKPSDPDSVFCKHCGTRLVADEPLPPIEREAVPAAKNDRWPVFLAVMSGTALLLSAVGFLFFLGDLASSPKWYSPLPSLFLAIGFLLCHTAAFLLFTLTGRSKPLLTVIPRIAASALAFVSIIVFRGEPPFDYIIAYCVLNAVMIHPVVFYLLDVWLKPSNRTLRVFHNIFGSICVFFCVGFSLSFRRPAAVFPLLALALLSAAYCAALYFRPENKRYIGK